MRKPLLVAAFMVLLPAGVRAQADSAHAGETGEVAGTVYDSVARAPIAGASIQLVLASHPYGDAHGAMSDAKGRFVISGIKPGRYIIGFQAEALDSLALESPLRAVDVRAGERAKMDLAVPSALTILTSLCGTMVKADSTGLLIGMLRDARTRMPLDTGSIAVAWQEMLITSSGISLSDRQASAPVSKEGWFAICGVPGGVDFNVTARHAADSTGVVAVNVPVAGLARHDFFIGGTAALRGSIVTERNLPLANARVEIVGRERAAITDSAGAFHLRDIPAGSQSVEIRALGYAPELRTMVLPAEGDSVLNVRLTSVKKVLDTIRVVGQRIYSKDSNGFLRRKRMGGGYYFDQETVQRERPFDLTHMLFRVPSIRLVQQGMNRTILMRGGASGYCAPALFLDGIRMPPEMLGDLDFLARPEELEGMEVYRSTNTPPQFSDMRTYGCGAIVIWTRPRIKPPKKKA